MEAKLLKGGKSVFDRTSEQDAALREKERELQAQREKETYEQSSFVCRLNVLKVDPQEA
jgi:hypothetical protein